MVTLRFRRVPRVRRWLPLVTALVLASQSFVEPINSQAEAEDSDANSTNKHGNSTSFNDF